jgi:hypothetical protein
MVLLLTLVRRLSVVSERQLVVCGAVVVTGAGAAWFVDRMMLLFR